MPVSTNSTLSIQGTSAQFASTNDSPTYLADVSVVIPVAQGDECWRNLLSDLVSLSHSAEIILSAAANAPNDWRSLTESLEFRCPVTWIKSSPGRADQLNAGAEETTGEFLWFLHADSQIDIRGLSALNEALRIEPYALHYFDLAFLDDGPRAVKCNARFAWYRSRWLGMPFGDQGFCLPRHIFFELGGYDSRAVYGEDHLFVWNARRAGVKLRPVGATLRTSARKYRDQGWLKTTLHHQWLTVRQAVPQALRMLFSNPRQKSEANKPGFSKKPGF